MNPKASQLSASILEKSDIEKVLALRESRKALADRLELIEKALDEAEEQVIGQVVAGVDLSRTGYAISISETERRFPKWKEHLIEIAGKAEADRIISETPATIYRKLIVK